MKDYINSCIVSSITGETKLNNKAIEFDGMSSFKVKNFLNRLVEHPGSKYLEIGVWKGCTFYSALCKNKPSYAVAIDDWSGFNGSSSMEEFKRNISDIESPFEIFCNDCFTFDKKLLKDKINVYFYDGDHSAVSQEMALTYYYEVLEDKFIFICDDWNAPDVQEGTRRGIAKTGLKILNEWILPAKFNGDKENWWNGLYVIYASK
jgi:hypothetical protein